MNYQSNKLNVTPIASLVIIASIFHFLIL